MTWRSCVSAHLLRCCVRARTKAEWESGGGVGGDEWLEGGFLWHPGHHERKCKRKGTSKAKHFDCVPPRSVGLYRKLKRSPHSLNKCCSRPYKNAAIVNYQCGLNCCVQSGWERDLLFPLKDVETILMKYIHGNLCIITDIPTSRVLTMRLVNVLFKL